MAFNIGAIVAKIRLDRGDWDGSRRQVGRDLALLGAEFGALGAMITGVLTNSVMEFGKFDRAIREATAVTADLTHREFLAMSSMAQDMSVALNLAATDTARAFYYLGSAGLSAREQLDAFNSTIMLSRSITEDTAITAEGLVDIMRAFQIEFSRSEEVSNTLVKSVITSNQVFSDLDAAMSYASSTMKLMNNTVAETAAALGVMANAGIKGCYDDQTEVLVRRGWIPWDAATMDDEFATLQPDTNMLEYQRPTRLIRYHHNGPMYHVANRGVDLCVTPEHRMWVRRRDAAGFEIMTAREVDGREVRYQAGGIGWDGNDPDTVTLPGFTRTHGPRTVEPAHIDAEVWATFLGWYISEGSSDYRRGNYRIRITQNPGVVRDRMRGVLAELPVTVNETKAGFTFANQQIWNYVNPLGKSWEKRIPDDVKNWSPRLLQLLLDALLEGDGDCNGVYYTSSHQLADDVMEVTLKAGYSATMGLAAAAGTTTVIRGREVRAAHDQWKVNMHRKLLHPGYNPNEYRGAHGDRLDGSKFGATSEWLPYDGEVFCAEVPNHLLIVRRNGKPVVSGNSMAGVALRRAVTNLVSPTAEMRDLLYELGVSVFDITTGVARPFIDVFGDISEALRDASEQYRNMAFEILFGRRAIAGMINVFNYGNKQLRAYADSLRDAGGEMARVTRWQMAAFLNQLGRVWQMVQRVSRLVGESLAPRIRAFADLLEARLVPLREWMETHRELVAQLALTVAKVGLLATALGGLALALPVIVWNLKLIFGLLTSPLILGIGAVVVAFYALRVAFGLTWDDIGTVLNTFGDTFAQWGRDLVINWRDSILGSMLSVFKAFANRVIHGWVLMFELVKRLADRLNTSWTSALLRLSPAYQLLRLMTSPLLGENEKSLIGQLIGDLQGGAPDYIGNAIGALTTEVPAAWRRMIQFAKQDIQSFKDWIAGIIPGLDEFMKLFRYSATPDFLALVPELKFPDFVNRRTAGAEISALDHMLTLWRDNIRKFIEEFETAGDTITGVFDDMSNGWETAFRGLMQEGSSFRDFMTSIFDSVYQSFVNMVAKMAAQGLAQAIFGPENAFNLPGRSASLLELLLGTRRGVPAFAPGLQTTPSTYNSGLSRLQPGMTGYYPPAADFTGGISAPKIALSITNAGPPVDVDITGVERNAEGIVLNATMKLAGTNAVFRRTFVNKGA